MTSIGSHKPVSALVRCFGLFMALLGAVLALGGAYLIFLGGSWYYLISGAAMAYSGVAISKGRLWGVWCYLALFAFTLVWAVSEVQFNFWALVPRTLVHLVLAIIALLLVPLFSPASAALKRGAVIAGVALLGVFIAALAGMFVPHGIVQNTIAFTPGKVTDLTAATGGEWTDYGRTGEGTRYAPFDQINVDNVDQLKVAWTTRHGDIAELGDENQNTPLYVDGVVYHCSPRNILTALDGDTGKTRWQFDPKAEAPFWNRCRSVAVYKPPKPDACGTRIVMATIDMRLLAIKTSDGELCESFGDHGAVNLQQGIGEAKPGFYMQTSGAMVAGDKILLSGWVADNMSVGEPSGVVRAFNAGTGELDWAWDLGNAKIDKLPPPGETYTRGTPNIWAPMSYDLDLGLVYLPTGNATPDYYGGLRTKAMDDYSSSIVAVDLSTGKERWKFQTVHHDLWDYDIPSQPSLVDFPMPDGTTVPGLILLTKRGQIFTFDRRDGTPLTKIEERPVPAGDVKGERYSPTQPYSVGMPAIGAAGLSETNAWGITPVDQLYCRIMFKKSIYKDDFTPPSLKPIIQFPSNYGGFNWGSASIDQERNLLIVNDLRMPIRTNLMPRAEIDKVMTSLGGAKPHGEWNPQYGTPYGLKLNMFMSPIGVPCVQPPFGTLTAIDLATRKVVWQRPVGTAEEVGPFGIATRLPIKVGLPTLGGTVTTSGGLVFMTGTQDYYLRAYDVETGEELWKGAIPTGGQATPITYIDKKSGRQFIVVNAAGAPHNPNDRGDYLVAFALPEKTKQ
ncbi:glucose dehydrogenase [Pseudomonas sp. J237]|nr:MULTISPECIES: membrane-bound PQQ-dependent dehydrogenase, glucose/quinate/shikimate family [Pseudomonas]OEO23147.1 glucose dehydrogenase [Pseudomonas sp. J237]